MAQVLSTAYGREHPGAGKKRRLMTNMLTMSASQVGNPVAVLVQMIADDRLVHKLTAGIKSVASDSLFPGEQKLPLLKRPFRTNCGR